jgi:hypothetical protein
MIYISCSSDGKNTEGIGSMAQGQLHTYAFAKIYNLNFVFNGFKNINHYQHNSISKEQFENMWNLFFNFKSKMLPDSCEIIDIHVLNKDMINYFLQLNKNIYLKIVPHLTNEFASKFMSEIEEKNILRDLKNNIILNDSDKYYKKNKINIGVHIRNLNNLDVCFDKHREYYNKNKIFYYENIFKNINNIFDYEKEIHIFSQGKEEDFQQIKNLNLKNTTFFLHLDERPDISLYHMINSDILICANSSFSYISSLLNDSFILCRDNFWHKTYNLTSFIDYEGNFNIKNSIIEKIKNNFIKRNL